MHKNLLDLTDEELMDLYDHNNHFKEMVTGQINYCKENISEELTIPEAMEGICDNLDSCADEWQIIVSGYNMIEISYNHHDKRIETNIWDQNGTDK